MRHAEAHFAGRLVGYSSAARLARSHAPATQKKFFSPLLRIDAERRKECAHSSQLGERLGIECAWPFIRD